jgi:predicted DNA-binding transcriptional regulator AlpA
MRPVPARQKKRTDGPDALDVSAIPRTHVGVKGEDATAVPATPGSGAGTGLAVALAACECTAPARGVCTALSELPDATLITPKALARALGRSESSVKRAVGRGELPPPVRVAGASRWTVGTIVRHVEKRLADAARRVQRTKRGIRRDSP